MYPILFHFEGKRTCEEFEHLAILGHIVIVYLWDICMHWQLATLFITILYHVRQ